MYSVCVHSAIGRSIQVSGTFSVLIPLSYIDPHSAVLTLTVHTDIYMDVCPEASFLSWEPKPVEQTSVLAKYVHVAHTCIVLSNNACICYLFIMRIHTKDSM